MKNSGFNVRRGAVRPAVAGAGYGRAVAGIFSIVLPLAAVFLSPVNAWPQGPAASSSAASRPNVIFLLADDLRASVIHEPGNENVVKTPNLDRLAAGGVALPHAYIMGAQGGAICVASRAMILTGQNLHHLRRNGKDIPSTATLIGETFAKAGYNTYGIGKWHNDTDSFMRCFQGGDEIMFGGMPQSQLEVPLSRYRKDGVYDEHCMSELPNANGFPMVCDHVYKGRHSSEIFADAAVKFLNDEQTTDPYFLYVAFTAPHDPRQAPKEFMDMYDLDAIDLPPNFMHKHPFDNGHTGRDEKLLGMPRKPDEVRKEIRDYYAIISHMDNQIGRILDTLEKTGEGDNTVIIFAGDNGLALGQHSLLGKQSVYEHSVNVPLIMSGPGIPKGEQGAAYVYLTEIYPTLCEMLNLDAPSTIDVKSFLGSLKDPQKPFHDDMFFAFRQLHRAVSDGHHKLIEYNVKGDRHTQLFDLKSDPWEMKNLEDDPAMKTTKAALKKKLLEYKDKWGDDGSFWDGY